LDNLDDETLEVISRGYQLLSNATGLRWLQMRLIERYPQSRAAAEATMDQWKVDHPAPTDEQRLEAALIL
jgi:hypothetical protein